MPALIERFRQVEKPESMPYSSLEAVVEGQRIIFRPGKRCYILQIGCNSLFCIMFLGVIMLVVQFFPKRILPLPLPLKHTLTGFLVLVAYLFIRWLIRNADYSSRIRFELNNHSSELTVYPIDRSAKWSLPIEDVRFFLGFEQPDTAQDTAGNYYTALYVVFADREVCNLTGIMNNPYIVKKTSKYLDTAAINQQSIWRKDL